MQRLYGLDEDLNLFGNRYQLAVSILFVTYIPSELPSNLVLKKLRPSRWIAFIATSWGIIATLSGVVQSYGGLIAARLFLGLVEGGLFPGMAVYLTLFYTKKEIALRIGYLFVSAALAGACGGLLAYGIGFMDGIAGQRGWRWILILEGLPTFVLGIACWFIMGDDYHTAWYLSTAEKELMQLRFARQLGQTTSAEKFHWADVRLALKDWKVWAFCFAQMGTDTMLYGFSTFLPTIIKGIGPQYSSAIVQVLTIPVYSLGAIVYLASAWLSDRQQLRGVYTVAFGLVSIIGYAILASPVSSGVHYFACFLVACGLYVAVGIPLAWLPSNCPRYGKRTTATGLQLTLGNTAGIWASFVSESSRLMRDTGHACMLTRLQLYPTQDAPHYIKGHVTTLALVAYSCCMYTMLSIAYARENRAKRAGQRDAKIVGLSKEEIAELGDENPRFMYTL